MVLFQNINSCIPDGVNKKFWNIQIKFSLMTTKIKYYIRGVTLDSTV